MKVSYFIPFIFSMLCIGSCKQREDVNNHRIPNIPVRVEINLNDFAYRALNRDGGFIYVTGGYKGIVIYRNSKVEYFAYERACPYNVSECDIVEMDSSNLFFKCCNNQFSLDGEVVSGPTYFPLKMYLVNLQGSFLFINN